MNGNIASEAQILRHQRYPHPMLGEKHSEDAKTKMRAKRKDRIFSPETKEKMSASKRGRSRKPFSEEWKRRIGEGARGRIVSETTRRKIGDGHRNKTISEEHRKQISDALRGRIPWMKGRKHTTESRRKMSETMTGRILPEEHRRNISAGHQGISLEEWSGFVQERKYCRLFNKRLKESIRNRDNRVCALCGKGEIQNGQRLSVHHIDSDKMQGCDGKPWYLCALCRSCNNSPDTVKKEFLIVTNQSQIRGRE